MKPTTLLPATMLVLAGLASPLAGQKGGSTLLIRVRTVETGAPLPDAEVVLDEQTFLGVTGPDGTLRATAVAAGEHRLRVRFIGFRTMDRIVNIEAAGLTELTVDLQPEPIPLDSISVLGFPSTMSHNMREFFDRRDRGLGYFITRADIDRVRPHVFSDLLRMIPGMRLDCGSFRDDCEAGMRSAPPTPGTTVREGGLMGPLKEDNCPIQYYVDGHYEPHTNVNDLRPKDIAGVEIYVHGAQAPARYSIRKNARCGVVLVWLRESLGR